jgi:hypothetical protein
MKKRVLAISLILIIIAAALAGCASNGDTPKYDAIYRVKKLPDTEAYLVNGEYLDLGIVYDRGLLGAGSKSYCVFYKEKESFLTKVVEFIFGGDDSYSYFTISDDVVAQIAQAENLTLPTEPKLPFFTEYITLIVLGAIALVIIVYFIVKLVRR